MTTATGILNNRKLGATQQQRNGEQGQLSSSSPSTVDFDPQQVVALETCPQHPAPCD